MKKINFDEVFKKYMAWIILLVVLFLFSFTKNFLSFANIVNILSQNSYAIICSLGVAFLMMAGEIDLSVGYIMSLCSVIAGILNVQMGIPAVPVILFHCSPYPLPSLSCSSVRTSFGSTNLWLFCLFASQAGPPITAQTS